MNMRDNSNETQVGSCAPAPGSPMICAALYDAARTVGEMDTLLELAKRAAVKAQNWEQARAALYSIANAGGQRPPASGGTSAPPCSAGGAA